MRLIRRREFLEGAGATLGLSAIPVAWAKAAYAAAGKDFSKRDPHFEVASIYNWYRKTFFDFNEHLSANERRFISHCMERNTESWALVFDDEFAYSLFAFSHRIRGSRVNSSRVFFTVPHPSQAPAELTRSIVEARGLDPARIPDFGNTVGFGWDVEAGHFKVYMLLDDLGAVRDPDMQKLLARAGDEPRWDVGLASVTVRDKAIFEKKVYVALKNADSKWVEKCPFRDKIMHTNLMITDRRGVVPQLDLRGRLERHLNAQAGRVAEQYRRQFHIEVDTVTYDGADDFTIYFPS